MEERRELIIRLLILVRGDAITVKIKDGCRRPYLSMDQNHFRANTIRSLREHLRQVSKYPTSGLAGDAITEISFGRDERTYERIEGWTPGSAPLD